ncbi:MAG: septal ring lytic transglycosylase RlpA family protein [Betaproteobacteria bacterium]|nr:septal ring lytic transglycosylase RlpA family protein [Betaproteobacteria bacterium]
MIRESRSGMRGLALAALALAAAGCASVSPRPPAIEREPAAAKPAPAPRVVRPGGYYQDDGPGDNPPNIGAIAEPEPRVEPLHRFANNPYNVFGRDYSPFRELRPFRERGVASWYGRKFHGQRTSSGEPYDMYAMTGAHPLLPIPSYARVTHLGNGRSVIVRINDRGPFRSERVIDLSWSAAAKLGYAEIGSALVEVEAITAADMPVLASRRGAQAPAPIASARGEAVARARPVAPAPASEASLLDPAPPRAAAPAPAAADAGGVFLQLGAFSARENAESFRTRLRQSLAWLGEAIHILHADGLFRVHLGPYRDRLEASGIAERIWRALEVRAVFVTR